MLQNARSAKEEEQRKHDTEEGIHGYVAKCTGFQQRNYGELNKG